MSLSQVNFDLRLNNLNERLIDLQAQTEEQRKKNDAYRTGTLMYEKFLEDSLMTTEGLQHQLNDKLEIMDAFLKSQQGICDWLSSDSTSDEKYEEAWQDGDLDLRFVPIEAEEYGTLKAPINLN